MKYVNIRSEDKKKAKKLESAINYMMDKEGINEDIKTLIKLLYKFEMVYGISLDLKIKGASK